MNPAISEPDMSVSDCRLHSFLNRNDLWNTELMQQISYQKIISQKKMTSEKDYLKTDNNSSQEFRETRKKEYYNLYKRMNENKALYMVVFIGSIVFSLFFDIILVVFAVFFYISIPDEEIRSILRICFIIFGLFAVVCEVYGIIEVKMHFDVVKEEEERKKNEDCGTHYL